MPFVMPLVIEVSGGRSLSSARHQATHACVCTRGVEPSTTRTKPIPMTQ